MIELIQLMSIMIGAYIIARMLIFLLREDPHMGRSAKVLSKSFAIITVLVTMACVGWILVGQSFEAEFRSLLPR